MALARRGSSTDTSRLSFSCRGIDTWYWASAWNTMMVACGNTARVTAAWGHRLGRPQSFLGGPKAEVTPSSGATSCHLKTLGGS